MADNVDQSLGSISVSISKGSVYESGGLSMYDATLEDARGREEKSISNEVVRKGDTLLDTYTVEADAISGGMGSVWRVHHQSWNTDLAMKRPQPRFFAEGSRRRKENFIKECEAWINLGLHPNIVSCYYVREIGGVPTIFSEWMNNGSLKDRIRDGSLYEGTEAGQEERLLDLAIQFSRGLRYSHENGLIHRDVKPDNLLLTKEWDAKVSDFGLAKARDEALSEEGAKHKGGYTPEYCSSEQAAGREADARSDVYSWALSVLEMYTKERKWESGPEVSENLEQYINAVKLPLPEDLRGLLTRCLEADADKRPGDFVEIEATLHKIYKSETGNDYPREASKAAADTADSLNNRALSMLDLGKIEQAERLWKAALAKDYICRDAAYNFLLYRHRTGSLHDDEVKEWLASLSRLTDDDSFRFRLCQLELECGRPMDVLLTLSGLHNKTDAVRKMAKYAAGVVESGDFPHMEWEKEDGDAPGAACLLAGGDIAFTSNRLSHANYLKRWDLTVGACVAKLSAPMGTSFDSLDFLRLSETERFILACRYNRMQLIEASSGIVHGSFGDVPDGKVDATSFSCDDRYLAAGIKGGVYIWDVETLEWVAEIPARGVNITSICLFGDGSMIIVAYDDKTLMIWDGADGGELSLIKTVNNVKAMRDYPDGKSICMVLTDGSVQRYWLCSGQTEVISEPGGGCTCERAAINRDCTLVVYGGRNKEHEGAGFYTQLKLIDTKTGRCYATFAAHYGALCDIALSGDGRRAISIGTDNKLRLWNTTRVECSAEYILSGITDTRTAATRQSRVNAELREAKACISSAEYANALAALSRAEGLVEGYDYPDEYWNLKWAVFKNCKVEGVTSIVPITNIVVENKVLSQIVFTDDTTVALLTKDSIELYGMNGEHKSSIEFMKPDDMGGAEFESEPCIVAVSGGGLLFVAVHDDLWKIDAGTGSVTARTAAPGQVFCMATDAHMKRLFTLGYSGMYADRVHIYRADTFHSEIEFNVSAKDYSVDCIAVDKAGNELIVLYSGRIGERGLLRSYSAESGRLTNEYEVHKKRGGAYQADPAHDFLYFVGVEGHLSRVDFSGGIENITRIEVEPAASLACSPDKEFVATCGGEGEAPLRIYSTEGAGRIFEIDLRHGAEMRDYELRPKFAAFSSDNRHIAVICGDKTVRILRLNWRLSATSI